MARFMLLTHCRHRCMTVPVIFTTAGRTYSGSLSLPFPDLLRDEHFLPADELQKLLSAQNMLNESRTLIYCGGRIAAALDGFACMLLGQQNVGVYDGSMSVGVDPDRPLKLGATP